MHGRIPGDSSVRGSTHLLSKTARHIEGCVRKREHRQAITGDIPFTDDFDSCTGHVVPLTGGQHLISQTTQDGTGQMRFVFVRLVQAVRRVSGTPYVLRRASTRVDLAGTTRGSTTIFTQISTETILRQGRNQRRRTMR